MANITTILNDQIRRLAKREITTQTRTTRKLTAQYRRDIAALKRQVAGLQKTVTFLERQEKKRVSVPPVPEVNGDIRFRADGLRSHRQRLGLSAEQYGRLVGASGISIYNWESGKFRPRKAQVAKLAAIRGLRKREAMKRLELLGGEKGTAPRRRKGAKANVTAKEFVLSLLRGRKTSTANEINSAWRKRGRTGKADNTLSVMVKAGELRRLKNEGGRGSKYKAAA